MNLFFEESGDFKAGHVLSHTGESYQVELPSGKRSKVRVKDVLLQFESPTAIELLAEAHLAADDLDLDFLWEVASTDEFGFAELGSEYFGHAPIPSEAAGLLMKLHAAPIYFHRKGKGRYKAAPEAALQAAKAGIEKKRLQSLLQAQYVEELKAGQLPQAMQPLVRQLLFKPDKNSLEFKALDAACNDLHTSAARLMLACGGIKSAKELHMSKFLLENFPKGTGFAPITIPAMPQLPVADVRAFSIDDVTTTEIDDAFSLQTLDNGLVRIGIHIAAPGLGIRPDDAIDAIARQRMSTVYMPGDKITMLPDELVQAFTLGAGQTRPALSLYATVDTADWSVVSTESRAEAVPMASNLRLNDLDHLVTEEALAADSGEYPHKAELAVLWQWAQVLEQGRMAKRESFGLRAEQTNRVDFNFYVEDDVVSVLRRKRGAPLDKIVAELMIFANSSWGKLLHEHGVPGIYRAQGGGSGNGWAAKMQVRMVTHAAPHQGLGVDQYAWSTSPLRRYTDLVNQWQLLACVEHGVTAPMVAPFKQRDANLFAIVSAFEAAYAAYGDFQSNMERYWCLRWLGQENAKQVEAVVLKDEIFRLVDIPLVIKLSGTPPMTRGAQVRLDLIGWDEVDLSVDARLLEVIAVPGADAVEVELNQEISEISDTEAETDVATGEEAAAIESESLEQEAAAEVEAGTGAGKDALPG